MANGKKLLAIIMTALAATAAISQPRTFLGPTAHLGIVKSITDDSAFALAGEAGPKNLRGSGTIGWEFDYHHRMKATAELLQQKLTYQFNDGQQDVWVGQGAVGAKYEYDFRQVDPLNTLLNLSAYYAYSPSKGLGVTTQTSNGTVSTIYKRLAGANAFGGGPGLSIETLNGTTAGADLTYDNVHYDMKNSPAKTVSGLGGIFRIGQMITDDIGINAAAEVRKPFNNYGANITFNNMEYYGIWALSAFGDYTLGKSTLPSSYNVGLGADYFFDATCHTEFPQPQHRPNPQQRYKDYKDYKDMPPLVWAEPNLVDNDLLKWVSVPAVRVPTVYKVPDKNIVTSCLGGTPPTLLGSIPDEGVIGGQPWFIDVAPYFSGSNLTYSINVTHNGDNSTVTISQSGVITITTTDFVDVDIVVTVTNGCGSVTSNSFRVTD